MTYRGNLYRRKPDGPWYGSVKVNGRWTKRSTGSRSKARAREILRKWQDATAAGAAGLPVFYPLKFRDLVDKYLAWGDLNKRQSTMTRERSIISAHLAPAFGDYALEKIDDLALDHYAETRKSDGSRGRTINLELLCLSAMMRRAVAWRHLAGAPWRRLPKVQETDSRARRALTFPEVQRVLAAARGPALLALQIAVYSGLRRGEVLTLRWDDVDLDQSMIHVRAKPELGWRPKSGKERSVPLHAELREILKSSQHPVASSQGAGKPSKTTGARGVSPSQGFIFSFDPRDGIEGAFRRAAVQGSFHSLRHTFATMMIHGGCDVRTLADILGHASPMITLSIYSHAFDQNKRAAIGRLPSFAEQAAEIIEIQTEAVRRGVAIADG